MARILGIPALVLALVLIASPAARASVQRNLIPILLYGGLAAAVGLVVTGRVHWLVAGGWAVMAGLRRILPWLWQLPWTRWLWQRWQRGQRPRDEQGNQRGQAGDNASGARADSRRGTMSAAEARETLGVAPDAAYDEIREAHRRLIQRAHPDRGGSAGLAQRINEARAVLLGETSHNGAA